MSGVIWKMGLELEDYRGEEIGKEEVKVGENIRWEMDFIGFRMRVRKIGGICSEIERKRWGLDIGSWLGLEIRKNW